MLSTVVLVVGSLQLLLERESQWAGEAARTTEGGKHHQHHGSASQQCSALRQPTTFARIDGLVQPAHRSVGSFFKFLVFV